MKESAVKITPLAKKIIKGVIPYGIVRLYQKYANTISNSTIIPDFFIVGSHGTGLGSITQYLSAINCKAFWWYYGERNTPVTIPSDIYKNAIICERVTDCNISLPYTGQHVFLSVRDPIEIMRSSVNLIMAQNFDFTARCIPYHSSLNQKTIIQKLFEAPLRNKLFIYGEKLNKFFSEGPVHVIDTKDLTPANAHNTLKFIADTLCIPMPSGIEKQLASQAGPLENKMFARFQPRILIHKGKEYLINVCPYDFLTVYYNRDHRKNIHIIQKITVDDVTYAIFICTDISEKQSEIDVSLPNDYVEIIKCHIKTFLKHRQIYKEQYAKIAISDDELVDIIKSDKILHSKSIAMWEKNLVMVKKYAPHKIENWKFYAKLFS